MEVEVCNEFAKGSVAATPNIVTKGTTRTQQGRPMSLESTDLHMPADPDAPFIQDGSDDSAEENDVIVDAPTDEFDEGSWQNLLVIEGWPC